MLVPCRAAPVLRSGCSSELSIQDRPGGSSVDNCTLQPTATLQSKKASVLTAVLYFVWQTQLDIYPR